jgi:hypothetical protein
MVTLERLARPPKANGSGCPPQLTTKDRLAEAVSEHGRLPRAAGQVGISLGYARRLWADIRAELGPQAV